MQVRFAGNRALDKMILDELRLNCFDPLVCDILVFNCVLVLDQRERQSGSCLKCGLITGADTKVPCLNSTLAGALAIRIGLVIIRAGNAVLPRPLVLVANL